VIAAVVLTGITACGATAPSAPADTSSPATTASSSVEVYPATGEHSFTKETRPSNDGDHTKPGRQLQCDESNFVSVEVPYLKTIEYNGVVIAFTQESSELPNQGLNGQLKVTVSFSGNREGFTPYGMIVQNSYVGGVGDSSSRRFDDQAVNLTGDARTASALHLQKVNFNTGGYINGVILCVPGA
jgi:hypothetical protein